MEKRVRSPNYPAISLREALDKAATLYKNMHTHAGPREVVAKAMGYASLNGSSMTVISALNKYGLLEGRGEEIKISDRAMRILHPENPTERSVAIREAATDPQLFAELDERFPGDLPSEELLRNYLLRHGFASGAVSQVILAYRDTKELVNAEAGGDDPRAESTREASSMLPAPSAPESRQAPSSSNITQHIQLDERLIARYDFEGGGHIRISVGGDVSTEEALDMAETMINLKRREIERRRTTLRDSTNEVEFEQIGGNDKNE